MTRFGLSAAVLVALAACSPSSSSTASSDASAAPAASSQPVNPPTSGAPPANAGDVQAHEGVGPGGPVNSPHRLHESRDGERG